VVTLAVGQVEFHTLAVAAPVAEVIQELVDENLNLQEAPFRRLSAPSIMFNEKAGGIIPPGFSVKTRPVPYG
jgi:hypothetical protein